MEGREPKSTRLRAANQPISNGNIRGIGWLAIAKTVAAFNGQYMVSEVAFQRKLEQAIQDIRIDMTEGILRYPRKHVWLLSNDFNLYLAKLMTESMDSLNRSHAIGEGMKSLEPHFAQSAAKDAAGKRTVLADMDPVLFGYDHSLDSSLPDPDPTSPRFKLQDEVLEWFVTLPSFARRDGRQFRHRVEARTHCARRTKSDGSEITLDESMDPDSNRDCGEEVVEGLDGGDLACLDGGLFSSCPTGLEV